MKPYKTVIYSFLLGGLLALIAQAMLVCTRTAFTGTPLEFWIGGSVLLLMGVVGCFLGGFGNYQYFEEWATFGALLPFSGFAMAVGMKMHGPYSKGATMGKSVWAGLWLVIWFNVVGAVVCILFVTLQMVRACQTGEYAQAGRIQTALMGLVDALFCEVNPIPVKQALALEGIPAGLPRLPLTPLSGSHLPVLEQMLSAMPEP